MLSLTLGLLIAVFPLVDRALFTSSVGWLLLASGASELLAEFVGRRSLQPRSFIVLALLTAAAGAILLLNPALEFLTMLNLVAATLAVRGMGVLIASRFVEDRMRPWLIARGLVDLCSAVLLLLSAPIAAFVALIFGGGDWTWAGAEALGVLLGASFAIEGFCGLAMAVAQRQTRLSEPG
ncbi:DUF308 domain-containing protein [Sphingomonas olei]